MTTHGSAAGISPPHSDPVINRIGSSDLNWALGKGWRDFMDRRGDVIFIGLLYPLIGLIVAAVTLNADLLPLLFPLVAGLSILGPAVASGFYELARRRADGEDAGWKHFLDPLRGPSRGTLAVLTLGLGVLFLAWLASASAIYQMTLGQRNPVGMAGFLSDMFNRREGWTMIILGNLTGLLFAAITLIVSVVSFPLVVDKPVDAVTAVRTSLRAVRENPLMIGQWGLRIAALLFLGAIPAFIGLAVVLPVLGYSTWHLYTRLVER